MNRISLILIFIISQSSVATKLNSSGHVQVHYESLDKMNLLDKLLPQLGADNMLNDIWGEIASSLATDASHGTKNAQNPLEALLTVGQKHSPSSSSNPLAALSSLFTILSSIASFSESPLSSLSSLTNKMASSISSSAAESFITDTDADKSSQELILSRGFSYDDHYVTTKDGAILHLFRIHNPFAQDALGSDNLHTVLLQHGFGLSSASWLINSPGENIVPWVNRHKPFVTGNNLATLLANSCCDVWLGNNRGNSYSTNHTKLDAPYDNKFWEYSVDEYAKEDAPAMVDYIRNVTRKDKISVIGYSLGSTQFLGLLSFAPEYADHIDLFIALAPVGYLGHVKGPIGKLSQNLLIHEIIKQYEGKFPPTMENEFIIKDLIMLFCNHRFTLIICATAFDYISGLNIQQLNQSRLFVYLNHLEPVSIKLIDHLFQIRQKNVFHHFDLGESENLNKYGYQESPKYPYSNIRLDRTVLISGLNDALSSPEDVHQLRKKLSGKILVDHVVKDPKWNHNDFIFGKSAYENVNKFIVDTIEKYAGKNLANSQTNHI